MRCIDFVVVIDSERYQNMKNNYGYMRGQYSQRGFKHAQPGWKKSMQQTYRMIEDDGYDSAMLQRFPVLRKAKDEGRDIRTQLYHNNRDKRRSQTQDDIYSSLNNSQ